VSPPHRYGSLSIACSSSGMLNSNGRELKRRDLLPFGVCRRSDFLATPGAQESRGPGLAAAPGSHARTLCECFDMSFRIIGLESRRFSHLFGLSDAELAIHGARRRIVTDKPGFPDRVEMRDLEIGETALLLNYVHQPANTPFRASHAIYLREGDGRTYDEVDTVPEVMRSRPIALRGFDREHMLCDATIAEGDDLEPAIDSVFANPQVAYIQAHYARPGCYAARIERTG